MTGYLTLWPAVFFWPAIVVGLILSALGLRGAVVPAGGRRYPHAPGRVVSLRYAEVPVRRVRARGMSTSGRVYRPMETSEDRLGLSRGYGRFLDRSRFNCVKRS